MYAAKRPPLNERDNECARQKGPFLNERDNECTRQKGPFLNERDNEYTRRQGELNGGDSSANANRLFWASPVRRRRNARIRGRLWYNRNVIFQEKGHPT